MKSFKSYINEAAKAGKNTHMQHAEDAVLYGGVNGIRQVINALRAMRNMLAGHSTTSTDVTVKWDGAPAVFAGIDPTDGQFFVAKKGIFNKEPKVYKSVEDVKADTSGDLQEKLIIAYQELSKLGIKGVVQGDIMFTKGDLKSENIEGEKFVVFHPNTIAYAVPANSDEAKIIKQAKIGVVWHTEYKGSSFETMQASYGVDITKFKKVSSVWSETATVRDLSGKATMTKADTEYVTKMLSRAGKIFNKISSTTIKELENNQQLAGLIETFNNSFVRKGEKVTNTEAHVKNLINWIHDRYAKEKEKRKSVAGKQKVKEKEDEILKFFSPSNTKSLKLMFDLQFALVEAKEYIIDQLEKTKKIDTFLLTKNGFKTTGSEGYVAIDKLNSGAYKLVKRMEFSRANFSNDTIKGWDSAARG